MYTERFDIDARVPAGTTPKDFQTMLKAMLAERFGMKFHIEQREIPIYELTQGKGGPRLREAAPAAPAAHAQAQSGKFSADGFPILPGSPPIINSNGRTRLQLLSASIEDLTKLLAGQLGRPVKDATNLTGKYDIVLYWVAPGTGLGLQRPNPNDPADPAMEPIPDAIKRHLGLRLDNKRGKVDTIVVDHINKSPLAN